MDFAAGEDDGAAAQTGLRVRRRGGIEDCQTVCRNGALDI